MERRVCSEEKGKEWKRERAERIERMQGRHERNSELIGRGVCQN